MRLRSLSIFPSQSVISMQMKRRRALQARISTPGILARLIEFQNAAGGLDVKAAKLVFQVIQVLCGDAVIFCAEKKQRHCGLPRKVEGFGENQQHFSLLVEQ